MPFPANLLVPGNQRSEIQGVIELSKQHPKESGEII